MSFFTVSFSRFAPSQVWGEENVPENALSRTFLDPSKRAFRLLCRGFLYRENRALTPEGCGKRTVRGGVPNPFLGGVSFVRFSYPLFFPPPHGALWKPWSWTLVCTPSEPPKGPFRTKNTTTIAKIVNYYAVVFLLRPPNSVRRGPLFERKMSVIPRKMVSAQGAPR